MQSEKAELNWRHPFPDFKLYYKARIIKTVWHWHQSRHIEKWNKIERPEINSYTYNQLLYDCGGKHAQWCWKITRKKQIEPYLSSHIKNNLKRIKDLTIKVSHKTPRRTHF